MVKKQTTSSKIPALLKKPIQKKKNKKTTITESEDQLVDFFSESKKKNRENENFTFNKATVKKSSLNAKKKKDKNKRNKSEIFQDFDEEINLGAKPQKEEPFQDFESFFSGFKQNFITFFLNNKTSLSALTKISPLKYKPENYVLGVICEKGGNNKYLVVNLSRNKKGFISLNDISDQNFNLDNYQVGEYVYGKIVPSIHEKKCQITLKTSAINSTLTYDDMFIGQTIIASFISEEDHGYSFDLGSKEKILCFMQKLPLLPPLIPGKPYLLSITTKKEKKKVINCILIDPLAQLKLTELQLEGQESSDFQHIVKPGSLFDVKVIKKLENGVLVRFLKYFYGFIFDEHLHLPLEALKKSQKFSGRVIYLDTDSKTIHFSSKENAISLKVFEKKNFEFKIGNLYDSFEVLKRLGGQNYLIKLAETDIIGFLSKNQRDDKEEMEGKIGKKIKIKEFNYFEGYPMLTMKSDFMGEGSTISWNDINVGDFYDTTIANIIKTDNKVMIKLNITEKVYGIVDFYNLSDNPSQYHLPKKLKIGGKINARILNYDASRKKLNFTIKPTFLSSETPIISDLTTLEAGNYYFGYISGSNEYGYFVNFFNDLHGFLSFKDLESNNISKISLSLGQTVKVFVVSFNLAEKKIKLSYSIKGVEHYKKLEERKKDIDIDQMIDLKNNDVENIEIGEVFDYKVDRKMSANLDFLILKTSKTNPEKKHKAVLIREHLSDFELNMDKLFDIYKKSKNLTIKGIVLQKTSCKNIQVTAKKSYLSQLVYKTFPLNHASITEKTRYYAYIGKIMKQGLILKFHENLSAFAPSTYIENFESNLPLFSKNTTVKIFIRKVESTENKIYASLLHKDVSVFDNINETSPFLSIFDEEALIFKRIGGKGCLHSKIKIGNFVKCIISHLKDYGALVDISLHEEKVTGFILTCNLVKEKKEYKIGGEINCQILDIDYEKEILDLREVEYEKEKFEKLANKENYLFEKIKKINVLKKENVKFNEGKVLLSKESYIICCLSQFPKIIFLLESRKFNDPKYNHENFENGQKISNLSVLNVKKIKKNFTLPTFDESFFLNKSNYLLVCEILPQTDKMEIEDPKAQKLDLKIGNFVTGRVTKIKGNNLYLQISKKIVGRIHKSQFDFDSMLSTSSFSSYPPSTLLSPKILQISSTPHLTLQLTLLKEHLNLPPGQLDQNLLIEEKFEEDESKSKKTENGKKTKRNASTIVTRVGQEINGVVKSISKGSINILYVELDNSHFGHCSVFEGFNTIEEIEEPDKFFKIGEVRKFFILGQEKDDKGFTIFRLSFNRGANVITTVNDVKKNEEYFVKLTNILSKGLRVQLASNVFGNVDITEICDEFLPNPLIRFKIGQILKARVLASSSPTSIVLSLRESMINEKLYKVIIEGSTQEYLKNFGEVERTGDLRNRIIKLGVNSLKVGTIFLGYVHQTNNNGCFIKIAQNLVGRAKLNDLSDEVVADSSITYYPNRLVIGRVVDILPDSKLCLSLKESVIKFGFTIQLSQLKEGSIIDGLVTGFFKDKAIINIIGCKESGMISLNDCEIEEEEIERVFKRGQKSKFVILNIKIDGKVKIRLGNKDVHFNSIENKQTLLAQLFPSSEEEFTLSLINSVKQTLENYEQSSHQNAEIKLKSDPLPIRKEAKEEEEEEDEEDEEEDEEEEEKENDEEEEVDDDDDEEGEEREEEDGEMEIEEEDEEDREEGEKEDGMEIEEDVRKKKKKTKRKKEKEFVEREMEIRKEEEKLRAEGAFEKREDFEKLLLRDINSSFTWIQYLAFVMEKEGIESAREIVERALKRISFKNENDKLNVWTAYMNLENNFGDERHLISVFERALSVNDPKKVYIKLIDIYRKKNEFNLILELCKKMLKKFKNSSKTWLLYIESLITFYHQQKTTFLQLFDEEHIKTVTKQALQSLKKKKHIKFLSHYGRIEFIHGDSEKGRTTYEAILANYPKRNDIWSIYLDLEEKYGTKDSARNLYERCISLSLKPKKMKFFFKRFLEYEIKQGSPERIEYVKTKANEYVESMMEKDETA